MRVLAVDDDPQALRYVRDTISDAGFALVATGDPEEALRLMTETRPQLVLLDLVLPGIDGVDLMHSLLAIARVPVIFLSAYGQDHLIARAFDMGATDYVVKPFSPTELAARIRAALRRQELPEPSEPFVLGDLVVDYARRAVTLAGSPVRLTAIEYRLLAELAVNAGAGEHLRAAAATGVGYGCRRRPATNENRAGRPSTQAGGRRRQPALHPTPSLAWATAWPSRKLRTRTGPPSPDPPPRAGIKEL